MCNIFQLALPIGVSFSDQYVNIIQLLLNGLDADNAIQINSQLFGEFGLSFAKICRDDLPFLELPSLPPDPILMLVAQKDSRRIIPGDKLLYMMLPDLPQCFLLIQQFINSDRPSSLFKMINRHHKNDTKILSYSCSTVLGLCGNRNEFKILKEVVHARQGMKHETKIALSDNKNKRSTGAFVGFLE